MNTEYLAVMPYFDRATDVFTCITFRLAAKDLGRAQAFLDWAREDERRLVRLLNDVLKADFKAADTPTGLEDDGYSFDKPLVFQPGALSDLPLVSCNVEMINRLGSTTTPRHE